MLKDNMQPGTTKQTVEVHESTARLMDDFKVTPEAKQTPPVVETINEGKDAPGENKPTTEPVNNYISPELSAEILIGTVDTIQTMVFSAINKRKMKKRFGDDMERLEVLLDKIEDGTATKDSIEDKDRTRLKKIRRLIEVYDNIPFTEEEKTELKKPLIGIIEQSNLQIPPGVALVIAVANVMAPRVADAFSE